MKKILIIALAVFLMAGCGKGIGTPTKNGGKLKNDKQEVSAQQISEENAKALVLTLIQGATEKDIRKFKKDFDDGKWEYDIEVVYNKMKYEFEINAKTGEIISWESESIYD